MVARPALAALPRCGPLQDTDLTGQLEYSTQVPPQRCCSLQGAGEPTAVRPPRLRRQLGPHRGAGGLQGSRVGAANIKFKHFIQICRFSGAAEATINSEFGAVKILLLLHVIV